MSCNCNNNCNCNSCTQVPTDCTCPTIIGSDCVTFTEDLTCSSVAKDQTLTATIKGLDEYVCQAISDLTTSINLVNVGDGAQVYSGIDNLGKRKLRTLKSSDDSVTITQNTDDIDLTVNFSDGSETIINAGTNISVTGNGTSGTPYIISNTADGSETIIQQGLNVAVTGLGTIANPYVINSTLPYQLCLATITQTSINAPAVTTLYNTLGSLTYSRVSTGIYRITAGTPIFQAGFIHFLLTNAQPLVGTYGVAISRLSTTILEIRTTVSGVLADDVLLEANLEIKRV